MSCNGLYGEQMARIKHLKKRVMAIDGMEGLLLTAGFTTRFGGVSTGVYESLNLSFFREDDPQRVRRNYALLSEELGVKPEQMVLSWQVHGTDILKAGCEHGGMGLVSDRSYGPVDGLSTEEKDLMLITYYADCVPLYFYDPVKEAICLSHSGWKGTLLDMAGKSVTKMTECFGSHPGDIRMSFGPHIRSCCFEVGDEVAEDFFKAFPWSRDSAVKNLSGKWMLNLEAIISRRLMEYGLKKENIKDCPICTRCEHETFFSHRGSGGITGTGAAFLMMKGS